MKKVLLFGLFLAFAFSLSFVSSVDWNNSALDNGLVYYWNFDNAGNKTDLVSGVVIDTFGSSLYTPNGSINGAWQGDDTGFGDTTENITLTGNYSISFWFKNLDQWSDGDGVNTPLMALTSPSQLLSQLSNCYQSVPAVSGYWGAGGFGYCKSTADIPQDSEGWFSGNWFHVVTTVEDGVAVKLYLNGAENWTEISSSMPTNIDLTGIWGFGSYNNGESGGIYTLKTTNFMDEIGVWNKVLTAEQVSTLYANGEGMSYAPLEADIPITNCTDLINIGNNLSGNYNITNNIDCTDTKNWNAGVGFIPLGTFQGILNGNNFNITNFFINRTSGLLNTGLFRTGGNSIVENINFINAYVRSDNTLGVLFGDGEYANINNVFVSGNLETSYSGIDGVGGIAGYFSGIMTNCSSISNVTCDDDTSCGLLIGYNGGQVTNSFSAGNLLSGSDYSGGLIGYNDGIINNTFSLANVQGTNSVGGLIGYNVGDLFNSYSAGVISGSTDVGGIVGLNDVGGNCYNLFWDNQTSGQTTSSCGTGKETTNMIMQSTFTGWDFNNVWRINNDTNNYPDLLFNQYFISEIIIPVEEIFIEPTNIFSIRCRDGDSLCKIMESGGAGIGVLIKYIIPAIVFILLIFAIVGFVVIVFKYLFTGKAWDIRLKR